MSVFAHFRLMINQIFLQNVPFFMQDIEVIYQFFYWISWVHCKNIGFWIIFLKIFLKKKGGKFKFLGCEIKQFLDRSHGPGWSWSTGFSMDSGSSNITLFGLPSPTSGFGRKWAFLRHQFGWFLAVLRHFWLFKMVLSGHTGNGS